MKKIFSIILILFIFLSLANFAWADNSSVELTYFYGSACPHCKKASAFLDKLEEKYPELTIERYEVFNNRQNAKLLLELLEASGQEKTVRVPAIFIGDKTIIGYLDDQTTGQKIEQAVKDLSIQEDQIIKYPIIGQINLSKLSLPVLTIVLAVLDGFNPCAMWILLFLIALLINLRSRKRIWLIAGTFILVSGLVYYLLLAAWLNLFLAISYVTITRIVIGLAALFFGIWQIKRFTAFKPGVCEVAKDGSIIKTRLKDHTERIVNNPVLIFSILGVIVLALGVNLIEFFCSAGLPAIYTRVLSLSNLSSSAYYLYLLLYTIIFMLDDMIVFAIAMITLSRVGFTDRYAKWSMLIGGLLIIILGLLLIFKPDFLAFG
ncbi:MAG: hypothetical protein CMI55_00740 [Parcubacteria group bacterium]|jgi:glutaredoxin|nr:hypothetical protein [Parcubacteria group bacterium]|tara:strand:- start:5128 stop:6255 length:1128 start_codon:yes stop_codon:yes gene_type:complete